MIVRGTIFVSSGVASNCRREHGDELTSAKIIKKHAEDMISDAGHTPSILVSSDTSYTFPEYGWPPQSHNTTDVLSELRNGGPYTDTGWLENHDDARESFNLMLITSGSADGSTGRASRPGWGQPRGCVKQGGVEVADHSLRSDQSGARASNVESIIRGALHEIGHNMGARHEHGYRWDGFDGWDYQPTYATLMGCTGSTNYETSCGESCSSKDTTDWFHRLSDCAKENMVW